MLEDELAKLKKVIEELTAIIGDKKLQMEVVKKEMLEIKKKYKEPRRSLIVDTDGSVMETETDEPKIVEDMVLAYTLNNCVKKMTLKSFLNADRSISERTTKNEILVCYTHAKSDQIVYAFTNKGNCVKIDMALVSECRYREKGNKFSDVSKETSRDEYPIALYALYEDNIQQKDLMFITEQGVVKRSTLAELYLGKSYYPVVKLKDGDKVISVCEAEPEKTLCFVTEQGKCLNAKLDDIPVQGRVAGGVKGMNLNKGDKVISAKTIDDCGEIIIITDNGYYKRVIAGDVEPISRGGKGVKICELTTNRVIFAGSVKEPYILALTDAMGLSYGVNTDDISIEGRTTKGKQLKNEHKKRLPISCYEVN
jgi:DNA gyrase/topoisomerase IV subunit A